jgi:hypothetical protein
MIINVFGGAAGIEPATRQAIPLLEDGLMFNGAISINTPINTPRLSGFNWMFLDSNREQHR